MLVGHVKGHSGKAEKKMPASLRLVLPLEVCMSDTWISLYTFIKYLSCYVVIQELMKTANSYKYSRYIIALMYVTEKFGL